MGSFTMLGGHYWRHILRNDYDLRDKILVPNSIEQSEGDPFISVIITAHDRRNYIIHAINSIIRQTLPREYYEIIVIKSFKDAKIEEFIARNGVKLIDTDTLAVGGKIALGVEQAKGQILSFLEDDDLFLESKLQVILDVFAKDANLGYLHNSFSVIDDKGAYIRDRKYKTAMSTVYLSNESVSRKKISKVISHDKFHNMSSVSIKKEILVRNLQELSIVSLGPDAFMFYAALESGQYLLFLEEKLTMYRKHMSLSNRNLQYIEFMNWNRTSNESIVNELNGVQSSLENQMAKEVIEVKILEFEILSHIAGTPCKQSQMVSLLEGYLRLLVKFRLWHSLLLVMVSVAWFFSGNIARKMYYIRYKSTLGSLYES